jgi:hypothetical protein
MLVSLAEGRVADFIGWFFKIDFVYGQKMSIVGVIIKVGLYKLLNIVYYILY